MATRNIPRIDGQLRDQLGSRHAGRLRRTGRLPAVIYGHGQQAVHVTFDAKELTDLMHHNVHVLEVACAGSDASCLIKEVQWDHLGSSILHLDLTRVDLTERVRTTVSLELVGDPVGLKEAGAILERMASEIEVECQAGAIPEQVRADISGLGVNQTLTVAGLELPEGMTCPMLPDTILATVSVVAVAAEDEEAAEEAEVQPEVITGKKEEGETESEN